jgi:hypothetical protein
MERKLESVKVLKVRCLRPSEVDADKGDVLERRQDVVEDYDRRTVGGDIEVLRGAAILEVV